MDKSSHIEDRTETLGGLEGRVIEFDASRVRLLIEGQLEFVARYRRAHPDLTFRPFDLVRFDWDPSPDQSRPRVIIRRRT